MNHVRTFPSSGYNPKSVARTAWVRKKVKAEKQFLKWLNRRHPDLLRRVLREADVSKSSLGLSGFGQTEETEESWLDTVLDTVGKIVPVWAGVEQQKELIKINERRAQQGLPPLNQPPTIRVEGEAGPETRAAVASGIKEAAGQYIPWIAAGLGIFFLTRPKTKRR